MRLPELVAIVSAIIMLDSAVFPVSARAAAGKTSPAGGTELVLVKEGKDAVPIVVFSNVDSSGDLLVARDRLLRAVARDPAEAVPALAEALLDDRPEIRLTAIHLLAKMGAPAVATVAMALEHPDHHVRLAAIDALARTSNLAAYWPTILMDVDPVVSRFVQLVLMQEHPLPKGEELERLMSQLTEIYHTGDAVQRRHVLGIFAAFDEMPPGSRRLLILATQDEAADIRRLAYGVVLDHIATDWAEAADLLEAALSDSSGDVKAVGREMRWKLMEVKQVRLPKDGWRFRIDPDNVGRGQSWYKPGFDDREWRDDVPIEESWKGRMQDVYNGVAWYRRSLDVPEAPGGNRVYLHFEGVDEEAWVWLNGKFVGEHAIGPEGWNVPFVLDVTEAVKLGAENQITVRARNTSGGAGVWRPVRLRIVNTDALN